MLRLGVVNLLLELTDVYWLDMMVLSITLASEVKEVSKALSGDRCLSYRRILHIILQSAFKHLV